MAEDKRNLRHDILEMLPFLAFFACLFFADQALFGPADALLGIVFLFFSRTIVHEPGLSPTNYARRAARFFLMAVCATLAGLNPIGMVIITFLYMFVVTAFNSDDYLPRNFFWLGLGYLLLLIYPATPDQVGTRLLAALFSIACTTGFIYLMRAAFSRTGELDIFVRDRNFIRRAFDEMAEQLLALADGRLDRIEPKRIFEIAQEYAKMEYGTVFRQDGLLSGRQSYTFELLVCVEQLAYNASAAALNYDKFSENEKAYYRDLAHILLGFGQGRLLTVRTFSQALEEFLATHKLGIPEHQESWRGVLETMHRTVVDTHMAGDISTPYLKSLGYRLFYLRENINLQNTQTRFALQMSVIVGLAMAANVALTQYLDAIYCIWIPITAFTILNTYNDQTLRSTANNFLGTMIGIGAFALALHFIPDAFRMPVILVLSYAIIMLDFGQAANVAAGTQIALTALYPYMSLQSTLVSRLLLVILAVTCVMMVIFLLLRTQRAKTIRAKLQELERIDLRLSEAVHKGLGRGYVNMWRTTQLLYYLHMDAELLSTLSASIAESQRKRQRFQRARNQKRAEADRQLARDVDRCLDLNYRFTMDAAHAAVLLDPRRARYELWREGGIYPDTPARLEHLDWTAGRLAAVAHDLERMRYLEDEEGAE